ncbi:MAG: DUF3127 domain-containing protein [Saprospiraceae bacterium]|nr:DUF3127 domain-containing protein [Saprospiraceae bacterium]
MQFTGKLVQVLPAQTGQGKNGEWRKQEIVLETEGQYPKKVCVSVWGDKMSHLTLTPGEMLTVDFDIESREYNGKWYTDVKAWKVTTATAADRAQSASQPQGQSFNQGGSYPQSYSKQTRNTDSFPSSPPPGADSFEDDLPF